VRGPIVSLTCVAVLASMWTVPRAPLVTQQFLPFKMEMQIIDLPFFESTMTKVCLADIGEGLVKISSSTNKD